MSEASSSRAESRAEQDSDLQAETVTHKEEPEKVCSPLASSPRAKDGVRSPSRKPRVQPNYFLAVRVSHCEEAVRAIQSVQAALSERVPALNAAHVEACTAHITLCVLRLTGDDDMRSAEEALARVADELSRDALLEPFHVPLEGLSHFNNKVLYLNAKPGHGFERLSQIAGAVRRGFGSCGSFRDAKPWQPHVTVAKLSKLAWREAKRVKQIPQDSYSALLNLAAGSVHVSEIQLCRMEGRRPNCYYHVHCTLPLQPASPLPVVLPVAPPPHYEAGDVVDVILS